jgi:hypothetical protein
MIMNRAEAMSCGQWVGFNAVSNKNSLSFGIDIGFKFSKLPKQRHWRN